MDDRVGQAWHGSDGIMDKKFIRVVAAADHNLKDDRKAKNPDFLFCWSSFLLSLLRQEHVKSLNILIN